MCLKFINSYVKTLSVCHRADTHARQFTATVDLNEGREWLVSAIL